MSDLVQPSAAQKWDACYQSVDPTAPVLPCWVLQKHSKFLPLKGKALDLACGLGGNARFMAMCGLKVDAWDISDVALTHLNNWAAVNQMPISPTIADIEQMLFPHAQYDVITVSNYLNRSVITQLLSALKPGGKLFYQTFLAPPQPNAPRNPEFYLKSGELTDRWQKDMTIWVSGEGWLPIAASDASDNNRARFAWLVAEKP